MGPTYQRRFFSARARSLSSSRTPPVIPLCVPNLSPTFPRRGRAHDRAFSGHLRTSSPLLSPAPRSPISPAHLCPQPNPLAPLSLYAHDPVAPLPLTEGRRPFCAHRRTRALSLALVNSASPSATWDILRVALSLFDLLGPRSPEHFLRSRRADVVDPHPCRTLASVRVFRGLPSR
jgi:hypothetical protein